MKILLITNHSYMLYRFRRELIAQLITDGGADYDDHAAAIAARDQAQADNEELRSANMKLFKRIGDHNDPDVDPDPKPKEKRKFEIS